MGLLNNITHPIKEARRKHKLFCAIDRYSTEFRIPFEMVAAVVLKESGGRQFARRYENGFYLEYLAGKAKHRLGGHWPAGISIETERRDRAYSFGYMQIMLQVAREFGFAEDNPFRLCRPEINIYYGCRKLRQCLDNEPNSWRALARYNGDPDKPAAQQYANETVQIINDRSWEALFK